MKDFKTGLARIIPVLSRSPKMPIFDEYALASCLCYQIMFNVAEIIENSDREDLT